jgi:hypothetical protein
MIDDDGPCGAGDFDGARQRQLYPRGERGTAFRPVANAFWRRFGRIAHWLSPSLIVLGTAAIAATNTGSTQSGIGSRRPVPGGADACFRSRASTDEALKPHLPALEQDGFRPIRCWRRCGRRRSGGKGRHGRRSHGFSADRPQFGTARPSAMWRAARCLSAVDTGTYEQVCGRGGGPDRTRRPPLRHSAREALGLSAYKAGTSPREGVVPGDRRRRDRATQCRNRAQMLLDNIAASGKALLNPAKGRAEGTDA